MSEAENKRIVQEFWDAFASGNSEKAFSLMADDFVWSVIGTTPLSGTYRGKQQVQEKFLAKVFEVVDAEAGVGLEIEELIAEGEKVVMRAKGSMKGRYGPYNNSYCHVMTVRDNLLRATVEYVDTALVNSALYSL